MIIAAVAEAKDCVVVTDNEKDFAAMDMVNPMRLAGRAPGKEPMNCTMRQTARDAARLEQGRFDPDYAERAYLTVIARELETVRDASLVFT